MRQFADYRIAIVSLAGLALLALCIGAFAAIRSARDGDDPPAGTKPDLPDLTHRISREHLSIAEMMGVFVAATTSAILAEAAPYWVNALAFAFLVSRLVHAIVQVGAVGPSKYDRRMGIVGWLMCAVLAVMAIVSAFSKA